MNMDKGDLTVKVGGTYDSYDYSAKGEPTINHPSHYDPQGIEAINVIEAWGLNFCLGSVVKYICRHGKKPGTDSLEDLQKAQWYLGREIESRKKRSEINETPLEPKE